MLATVLFTDIAESTRLVRELGDSGWREVIDRHDDLVREQLRRFDGRQVKHLGDGVLAVFDGPTRALSCASRIGDGAAELGLAVRAGLHAGECEARGADLAGLAVNTAARIGALAGPGEILVSSTVRDLVAGSRIPFEDRGRCKLRGLPGHWQLYAAGRPAPMLRVRLLGPLSLEVDGAAIAPPSSRPARELLAWLALHPGMHARAELAARLWPDVQDTSARASLRVALSNLRQALGGDAERYLAVTRERIGLGSGESVQVDVREFSAHVRAGSLEDAAALCMGPLLDGFTDEWVLDARMTQDERLGDVYRQLADSAEATSPGAALEWSRRWVALDPLSETATRDLMARLARLGDRASALTLYERFAERLRTELSVAPSEPTRRLAAALKEPPSEPGPPADPPDVGLPVSLDQLGRAPVVGRERERSLVWEEWQQVVAGETRFVAIAGEAGVGKSSLCAAIARACRGSGANVLLGRATEDSPAPFEPWVDALGHLFASLQRPQLERVLGAGRADVSRLFPALGTGSGGQPSAPGDAEGERFRLLQALAGVLERTAHERSLVVLLEDLHWADEASLLLLRHIARGHGQGRLLVLCTYRTHDGEQELLRQALVDLRRTLALRELTVEPLEEEDVRDVIAGLAGARPATAALRAVFGRTAGNPLFVTETVRHLLASGASRVEAGEWTVDEGADASAVPTGVKDLIRQRLRALGDPARRALTDGAVVGPEFEFELLDRLGDEDQDSLAAGIDEALEAGLVREVEGSVGSFCFTHALVRESIYDDISVLRRARLHIAVGRALEDLHRDDPAPPVERLARHFVAGGAIGDRDRAVGYAIAAGNIAREQLAYERAASHYEDALSLWRSAGRGGDPRTCEVLVQLGECRWASGRFSDARSVFREAAATAEGCGDAALLARAVLGLGGKTAGFETGVVDPELIRLLERALDMSPRGDSETRARLLARLAEAVCFVASEQDRKAALVEESRTMAARLGSPGTLAQVLHTTTFATWGADGARGRAATVGEVVRHAEAAGETVVAAATRVWRFICELELGDASSLRRAYTDLEAHSDGVRSNYERWLSGLTKSAGPWLQGEIAGFEEAALDALQSATSDQLNAQMAFGAQVALCRREQDRLAEVVDGVRAFAESQPTMPIWRCALAWMLGDCGRLDDARDELQRVVMQGVIEGPRDLFWLPAMFMLGDAAVLTDDGDVAAGVLDALLPYQEQGVVLGPVPVALGPVTFTLGTLAGELGHDDDAAGFLERAVDHADRLEAPYWRAYAEVELARVLARSGRPDDRRRARELAGAAAAFADERGLHALRRRIENRIRDVT